MGVHIADVTNYVQENSALDREALARGTSVYLVDRVIPMLPHKLSNGICSLNEGQNRLALSCIMTVSPKGEVIDYRIVESVICVNKRMNYTSVNKIIELKDEAERNAFAEFVPMLDKMEELSSILQGLRKERGSIDFDFPESKIILHIDSSGDLNRCLWWFSCAEKSNLDYDIIGLSYYSLWHGTDLSKLETCVKTLSEKFDKSVFIVETAYPFTLGWKDNLSNLYGMKNQLIEGFEASSQGQKSYFEQLCALMNRSVKNHPSAIFWWEPTCISEPNKNLSSPIENLTWFDFQNRYIGPL